MKNAAHLNLICAWAGILMGFISGLAMGLFFDRDKWLGGYASFKRRLYRLGHISFFGLGATNLLFYFTAQILPANQFLPIASFAFIVSAISMPLVCLVMAHFPEVKMLFAIPVLSALAGGSLTLLQLINL